MTGARIPYSPTTMNTTVHDITSSTEAMNLSSDEEEQPRLTLQERQAIAKDRFQKAKQVCPLVVCGVR